MEPYPIFKLYAGDDEELNYDEFCALLDRFDIEMIEDRRRMFFAKVGPHCRAHEDLSSKKSYVVFEKNRLMKMATELLDMSSLKRLGNEYKEK